MLDGERVCGVLSATDLLGLDARSPIALRHMILGAPRRGRAGRAPPDSCRSCFCCWRGPACPPRELGRVLSLQHDAVVARLIDFSIWPHGAGSACRGAWLDLGSAARREFTLASDQDNALAYADARAGQRRPRSTRTSSAWAPTSTTGWSDAASASTTTACWLGNRLWRMSKTDWLKTFDECLERSRRVAPDPGHGVV